MDELLARLRAAVRRATPAPAEPVVTTRDFTVDLSAKRVTRDGADVRLTPTEWQLLEVLARNPDRPQWTVGPPPATGPAARPCRTAW